MGNCSCGGGAKTASTALTTTKKTASTPAVCQPAPVDTRKCDPHPWKPSCETQTALASCMKQVICDFLRCVDRNLCPDGHLNLRDEELGSKLIDCLGDTICGALHCIPEALCPEPPAAPPAQDDLPCNFAVEE